MIRRQLLDRMDHLVPADRLEAQQPHDAVAHRVHHGDEGAHQRGEPQQRLGHPQADRVGPLQRHGLGRQLAQDHVQERDQR